MEDAELGFGRYAITVLKILVWLATANASSNFR